MKVAWKPRPGETGASIILGDDSLGFRRAGSKFVALAEPVEINWQNQPALFPRADVAEHFGRENKLTQYVVSIDYQFSTIPERTAFQHRVALDFPNEGTLEISHDNGSQDSMEAVIQRIAKVNSNGVSLMLQYTFLGGAFSKGPATNLVPIVPAEN